MTHVLKLRPKAGMRARRGAPWIFSNEIVMDQGAKALPPGASVTVRGDDGVFVGTGTFNAHSLIAVRILSRNEGEALDTAFFTTRMEEALRLRQRLFDKPFYRLLHAEGDYLPGLIADRYGDIICVQSNTAGMDRLMPQWLPALEAVTGARAIVLRNDTPARTLEGLTQEVTVLKGAAGPIETLEENDCRYLFDPLGGQKTGWYYDMRHWRAFMAGMARGARVLDLFCHSGGFGIQAAKAGALDVVFADSSQPALDLALQAAALNGVAAQCRAIKGDAFETIVALAQDDSFDIVIADPPPFVRSRKDLEPGARAYQKLARGAAPLVKPGGLLFIASCSHAIEPERFLSECAGGLTRAGRRAKLIAQGGASPDHPVHPHLPESAYLKALVFELQ